MDAKRLAEALKSLDNQNFGPNDSMLASTINHPVNAGGKFLDWLKNQVNTAAGIPDQYDNPNPLLAPKGQEQAAFDLAGMAQLGSMPFAPKSSGGTLGTLAKPAMATDGNLNEELLAKYLREGQLSPQELAQYETNAVQMTDSGKHHYNLANANAQGGTPESRAVDLGFDTPAYHGTNSVFDEFDPMLGDVRRKTGTPVGSVVVSSSPETASTYAGEIPSSLFNNTYNYHESGNVLPLLINKGKNLSVNAKGDNWDDLYLPKYPDATATNDIAGIAIDKGKDSATIKNVIDNAVRSSFKGDTSFLFKPQNIRLRFAAFDPLRKDSANLLATRLLPATMLGYGMANQKPDNQSIAEALRGQ